MRPLMPALIAAAMLFTAPAALGAPTCQDRNGDATRCGTPTAMPVGWTASPQVLADREASRPVDPTTNELLGLLCVIGGLLALIALMPEFDGWRPGDWDRQEDDDDE